MLFCVVVFLEENAFKIPLFPLTNVDGLGTWWDVCFESCSLGIWCLDPGMLVGRVLGCKVSGGVRVS